MSTAGERPPPLYFENISTDTSTGYCVVPLPDSIDPFTTAVKRLNPGWGTDTAQWVSSREGLFLCQVVFVRALGEFWAMVDVMWIALIRGHLVMIMKILRFCSGRAREDPVPGRAKTRLKVPAGAKGRERRQTCSCVGEKRSHAVSDALALRCLRRPMSHL